jgi:O-antigen ligase
LLAVLLTASRGGFLAAVVALAGCAILLGRGHPRRILAGVLALPVLAAGIWLAVPRASFERLSTITEQLQGGDLNDRVNIWVIGWQAFVKAPIFGSGAGSFVSASGLAPVNTAHNTPLTLVVTGGLCALMLAAAIVALAARSVLATRGPLRLALATSLAVWIMASLVSALEESRTTWLLLALIAVAGRMAVEKPEPVNQGWNYG